MGNLSEELRGDCEAASPVDEGGKRGEDQLHRGEKKELGARRAALIAFRSE
jgi:hypothetical protein